MKYFPMKFFAVLLIMMLPLTFLSAQKKITLFKRDKQNIDWYIYTAKSGRNDSLHVFTFHKNIIHASGEDFAYIITNKKYANFHLSVEFKWGEKKYPPREKEKRDGGILYHVNLYSGNKIWPRSIEFQVQEGDCGDFWMTDSTTIIHNDTLTVPKNWLRAIKSNNAEKPNGQWNKAEVIVQNGTITHLLNGVQVNTARPGNTTEGNILLQSEGAEIYYRNVRLQEF